MHQSVNSTAEPKPLTISPNSNNRSRVAEEDIPETRASQLRQIRQNLSFARITLQEAKQQADFLLVGVGLAEVLRRPFESLIQAIEKVRASHSVVESLLPDFTAVAAEIREQGGQLLPTDPNLEEFTRVYLKTRDLYHTLERSNASLQKQVKKFKERCQMLTFFAPDTKKDADPFLERLSTEVAPFEKQLSELKAMLKEHEKFCQKTGPPIVFTSGPLSA